MPVPEPTTITISLDKWHRLIKDQALLRALQAAGVDNWEGYDEARRPLSGDDEDESADDIYGEDKS